MPASARCILYWVLAAALAGLSRHAMHMGKERRGAPCIGVHVMHAVPDATHLWLLLQSCKDRTVIDL